MWRVPGDFHRQRGSHAVAMGRSSPAGRIPNTAGTVRRRSVGPRIAGRGADRDSPGEGGSAARPTAGRAVGAESHRPRPTAQILARPLAAPQWVVLVDPGGPGVGF